MRRDDEESATADLIAAQALDLGDFFVFAIVGREQLREEEGGTIEFRVRAELAGRLFEEVLIDVGFSDPLGWESESLRGSDLLAFADIEPIEVPALSLEQRVAEKVHAYTRTYGGHPSSRVKDLVDLVLVKRFMSIDAERLYAALAEVFEARGQQARDTHLPILGELAANASKMRFHRSRCCLRSLGQIPQCMEFGFRGRDRFDEIVGMLDPRLSGLRSRCARSAGRRARRHRAACTNSWSRSSSTRC